MERQLWLFAKHGNDIGDNAFVFYKYVKSNHPEIRCVYVADSNSPEAYQKAKEEGEVVQYRSREHKALFLKADKIITSHVGDSEPWDYAFVAKLRKRFPRWAQKHKIIHLQHGVIDKNVAHIYSSELRPVDLFISSTEKEKSYIERTLGYRPEQVPCTGLARFDDLYGSETEKEKLILLIPRYRKDVMVALPENKIKLKYHFMNTQFYRRYQELLQDEILADMLDKYDYRMIFYPHYEVQALIGCFHTKSDRIILADRNRYSLDELLKKCALMITDYSSVAFDFAYMRKPVIYYQFDRDEFIVEYGGSYFDHERDGFGPVVRTKKNCLSEVLDYLKEQFDLAGSYSKRCRNTFPNYDKKNCERIYGKIMAL